MRLMPTDAEVYFWLMDGGFLLPDPERFGPNLAVTSRCHAMTPRPGRVRR